MLGLQGPGDQFGTRDSSLEVCVDEGGQRVRVPKEGKCSGRVEGTEC